MKTIKSMFNSSNIVQGVDDKKYQMLPGIIRMSEAMSTLLGYCVYITDYCKQDIAYASDNMAGWCVASPEEAKEGGRYVLFNKMTDDDFELMKEINDSVMQFWKGRSMSEKAYLSCSVRYDILMGDYFLEQHFRPLAIHEGSVWLGMTVVRFACRKGRASILMNLHESNEYFEYSVESKQWTPCPPPSEPTEDEKEWRI